MLWPHYDRQFVCHTCTQIKLAEILAVDVGSRMSQKPYSPWWEIHRYADMLLDAANTSKVSQDTVYYVSIGFQVGGEISHFKLLILSSQLCNDVGVLLKDTSNGECYISKTQPN